jgi:hypothetical protein
LRCPNVLLWDKCNVVGACFWVANRNRGGFLIPSKSFPHQPQKPVRFDPSSLVLQGRLHVIAAPFGVAKPSTRPPACRFFAINVPLEVGLAKVLSEGSWKFAIWVEVLESLELSGKAEVREKDSWVRKRRLPPSYQTPL